MSDYQIWDFDDYGVDYVISDMCQSHDCSDKLEELKAANPAFKVTLFAIPEYMKVRLLNWVQNNNWVEIALHGFTHSSNYECEKMTRQEFDALINKYDHVWFDYVKGFKAPGWQISDDIYQWLNDYSWWVADQAYNDERRPEELPVYKVGENSVHGHTWDCVGNGIYETLPQLLEKVKQTDDFRFVSEVVQ